MYITAQPRPWNMPFLFEIISSSINNHSSLRLTHSNTDTYLSLVLYPSSSSSLRNTLSPYIPNQLHPFTTIMKVRSFSVVAATCLAGTEATMKVRSLSVVAATCMAGAEAVAIGARDPSLGSMLNGLFGGGPRGGPGTGAPPPPPASGPTPPAPGGPGGVNTAKPFDFGGFNKAMGGIERELKDATNPTRPLFFGFGSMSVPMSSTVSLAH